MPPTETEHGLEVRAVVAAFGMILLAAGVCACAARPRLPTAARRPSPSGRTGTSYWLCVHALTFSSFVAVLSAIVVANVIHGGAGTQHTLTGTTIERMLTVRTLRPHRPPPPHAP